MFLTFPFHLLQIVIRQLMIRTAPMTDVISEGHVTLVILDLDLLTLQELE